MSELLNPSEKYEKQSVFDEFHAFRGHFMCLDSVLFKMIEIAQAGQGVACVLGMGFVSPCLTLIFGGYLIYFGRRMSLNN